MRRLDKINKIRRSVNHSLTKNIGNSNKKYNPTNLVKRILISRPNGRLGNLLMVTPLIQEIACTFPQAKIDLFVKGDASNNIFKNYENIAQIIKLPAKPFKALFEYFKIWFAIRKYSYDLVINIDAESLSGKLSTMFAKSTYKIFGDEYKSQIQGTKHMAKQPVYNFRNFIRKYGHRFVPALNLRLRGAEIEAGKKKLDEIVDSSKSTIAIFTFATGEKMHPVSWWKSIYDKLQIAFPEYNILEILPIQNVSQLDFNAPTFYSKDIREIAAVIANMAVFIGADSGLMHLASASQIPVVGLFRATDANKYGPYGNDSISIDTNQYDVETIVEMIGNGIDSRRSRKIA